MNLIAFLLLFAPLVYHLWNDRNGEAPEDKVIDILIVVIIACAAALLGYKMVAKPIIDGLLLAAGIHFMAFDYLIVAILNRRVYEKKVNWFYHLGKSYTDDVLRQWSLKIRFFIKLGILSGCLIVYWV